MKLLALLLVSAAVFRVKGQKQFNIEFQQSDYNATLERMQVVHFNKQFMSRFELTTFKYNRTCTAFNSTFNFICDAGKLEVLVQAYRFVSNEYRMFPIRAQYNFYKAIQQNFAGAGKSSCGNFNGRPLVKGRTYSICNWTLDQQKLPPYIPLGKYKIECRYLYDSNVDVALFEVYGSVTRPEV